MKEELYYKIDEEDELSDSDKREIYRSEMQQEKDEEEWQEGQW